MAEYLKYFTNMLFTKLHVSLKEKMTGLHRCCKSRVSSQSSIWNLVICVDVYSSFFHFSSTQTLSGGTKTSVCQVWITQIQQQSLWDLPSNLLLCSWFICSSPCTPGSHTGVLQQELVLSVLQKCFISGLRLGHTQADWSIPVIPYVFNLPCF